jgi:hypothetical protein
MHAHRERYGENASQLQLEISADPDDERVCGGFVTPATKSDRPCIGSIEQASASLKNMNRRTRENWRFRSTRRLARRQQSGYGHHLPPQQKQSVQDEW